MRGMTALKTRNIAVLNLVCNPDDPVNLFDIFALLDAFTGIDPCCTP